MQNKSKLEIAGTLIAAVALVGPICYLCLALFELGRLDYFDAPRDFISFGSFGIYQMLSKLFPVAVMMLPTIGMFVIAFTVKGKMRFVRISAGLGMTLCMLSIYSASDAWKWGFGAAMFLCIIPGLLINYSAPDVGNLEDEIEPEPENPVFSSARRLRSSFFCAIPLCVFAWIFAAAGARDAESQKEFWESKEGVIIGFYGENVLLMPRHGATFGSDFKVIKLENAGELVLKTLGPDIKKKLVTGSR
ncbi:hypothetical protein RA263_26885 [Pseudomonas syringae pv. tagetis]|uniref:Uncharacterized protein n=1 Tax=Pseudomonas syringae pv. tagetis TaxID=129140 RepID=A0A0N8T4N9_9PSED|nr:hypothetical protein [Pseudomonas syringae group genomosp. 7]KPY88920.1 Uncharacterized protein ALO44_00275 [Pseudomonas syringae pv. tagetis]RMW13787.1 hypothetical protein ALO98_02103 [Pseudomonas syringae pv. tagetis]RMW23608.1 hypothetical protein ALO97_03378 [Pseudomonas syringae pv. tagetis]UNB70755.1 hypothetical protein MME58_11245 [Pseudomonas syringae pv. tagetis]